MRSPYERARVAETSRRRRAVSPATVNRELALLRHLLRLAEEWGYIARAPKIRMLREDETGRRTADVGRSR